MSSIDPILACRYYAACGPRETPPVKLFFDTNVVFSAVVGVSDVFFEEGRLGQRAFTCKRFWSDDTKLASILLNRPEYLDMTAAHRLELYFLLKQRRYEGRVDIRDLFERFFSECGPPESLDLQESGGTFRLTLDPKTDYDHSGLKCIFKLKSLLIKQQTSAVSFGNLLDRGSPISKREVDAIVGSELFQRALKLYEAIPLATKSEQAKIIDCAAICLLAEKVESYNESQLKDRGVIAAPFFVANSNSAIFVTLKNLVREDDLRSLFSLRQQGVEAPVFAFQPPLFLELLYAYVGKNWALSMGWPFSEDVLAGLRRLGGSLREAVAPHELNDAPGNLSKQLESHLWGSILLDREARESGTAQQAGNLSYVVVFEEPDRKKEEQFVQALAQTAQETRALARVIAWTHRAENTAKVLGEYFARLGVSGERVSALLRIYDFMFAGTVDLGTRLSSVLRECPGVNDALVRLLRDAWAEFNRASEAGLGNSMSRADRDRRVARLVVLLWIAVGSELERSEYDDLLELLEEVVGWYGEGGAGWRESPEVLSSFPVWLVVALLKCRYYEYLQGRLGDAAVEVGQSVALTYEHGLDVLHKQLQHAKGALSQISLLARISCVRREYAAILCGAGMGGDSREATIEADGPTINGSLKEVLEPVASREMRASLDMAWEAFCRARVELGQSYELIQFVANSYLYSLVSARFAFGEMDYGNAKEAASVLLGAKARGELGVFWFYDHTLAMYYVRLAMVASSRNNEDMRLMFYKMALDSLPPVEHASSFEPSSGTLREFIVQELFFVVGQ